MHRSSLSTDTATQLQLALVSMIWGGTFVAGRGISSDLPPLVLASFRFLVATAVLLLVLKFSKKGFVRITRSQAMKIAGLGFCGVFLYNVCFFYGLREIDASRASLIIATNPAVMTIFAYLFLGERLTPARILAVAICILGAGLVIAGRSPSALVGGGSMLGDALMLGCVVSWVIYSVFCKGLVEEIGALQTVAYSVAFGAVALTIASAATGQAAQFDIASLSPGTVLGLLYLGALGSALAYVLYYQGIERIGASRAGMFIALNPLTSVVAGMLLLGERPGGQVAIGGSLIVLGIVLSNRRRGEAPVNGGNT